uniref:C-type lectin domain-containing protein n=1 Tax=Lotharella globosa TaxID=91324 RepID=A0A7S4DYJ9_9EUKA|mmetsp:Transcript_4401/g.7876  ORF Transcript_4401/g.7876 Transcript_4401/m.7876 type:complete len:262 (+) Transcript_4401:148-933(+)
MLPLPSNDNPASTNALRSHLVASQKLAALAASLIFIAAIGLLFFSAASAAAKASTQHSHGFTVAMETLFPGSSYSDGEAGKLGPRKMQHSLEVCPFEPFSEAVVPGGYKKIEVYALPYSWDLAKSYCACRNATLASIRTEAELESFQAATKGVHSFVWIGLSSLGLRATKDSSPRSDDFAWDDDGSRLDAGMFSNWYPLEPSDEWVVAVNYGTSELVTGTGARCTAASPSGIDTDSRWTTQMCDFPQLFACSRLAGTVDSS